MDSPNQNPSSGAGTSDATNVAKDTLSVRTPMLVSINTDSNNSTTGTSTKALKQPQMFLKLDQLPGLVLDKILNLLEPQDLRSTHQVCKTWQNILLCRPRIDSRRVELVTKIRLNKENIARGCSLGSLTPSSKNNGGTKNLELDGKPGSRNILRTISNSRPNSSITSTKKPPTRCLSTPTSRFLEEYEAGTKLVHGQILFRCPKCTGPVPSPVPAKTVQGSFRQKTDSSTLPLTSSTATTQVLTAISPSSNTTEDFSFESGFEDQLSMVSIDEDTTEDETNEILSMSFIPSPLPSSLSSSSSSSTKQKSNRAGILKQEDSKQPLILDSDTGFSSCSSSTSDLYCQFEQKENESTECPKCFHRFCCHCLCTEHPGRPCQEISGDSLFTDSCNSSGTANENINLKSDKAIKRSKKALRRLARV